MAIAVAKDVRRIDWRDEKLERVDMGRWKFDGVTSTMGCILVGDVYNDPASTRQ